MLRVLGYRYSYNREAWVHRVGGGRFGPVFTEVASFGVSEMPMELVGRLEEQLNEPSKIRVLPAEDRSSLPQRATRRRGDRLIPVRWLHDEEHKIVYVDGRPPSVGPDRTVEEPAPAPARPKVVPIKSSRATG